MRLPDSISSNVPAYLAALELINTKYKDMIEEERAANAEFQYRIGVQKFLLGDLKGSRRNFYSSIHSAWWSVLPWHAMVFSYLGQDLFPKDGTARGTVF